ncbi:MAG: glycosyltransferase family 2 protein [Thermodesulfovibrionia bacterium]
MKIATLVVTCNRKEMVSRLLEDLDNQTRKPDGVIVVDNGSKDGTPEHIRRNFPWVNLIVNSSNIGLDGALAVGIRDALKGDYDAFIIIDDDAHMRDDTLEALLNSIEREPRLRESIIWSAHVTPDERFFTEPVCVKVDGEWKIYQEFSSDLHGKVYETIGSGATIGIYIPKKAIEVVGLPRPELAFIGQMDWNYRFTQAGFKEYYCFSSIIYHKRHSFYEYKFLGKRRFVSNVPPWHTYYEFRNRIYMDRLYKRRSIFKSLFITAVDSIYKLYIVEDKIQTLKYILRAIYDGFFDRMGMRVEIPRG